MLDPKVEAQIERVGRLICGDARHEQTKADPALFQALATRSGDQKDVDGFVLLELARCNACGTTLARLASEEAGRRLSENSP